MTAPHIDIPAATAEPGVNVALVMGAVVSVLLLASLGHNIMSTALPVIVADLGGADQLSWSITAYLLASTVAAPLSGKLGDMVGRKIVLQVCILVFLVGSALAAAAPDMVVLVIARVVQGLGGGGLMVSAIAAVGDVVEPRKRAGAQGMMGMVWGFSTVAGPLVGGIIVEHFSWRWIFLVNMPIGLAALVVIGLAFKSRPERSTKPVDGAGAGLLALMLSSLVLYASLGGVTIPWLGPVGLLMIVTAVASLAGFVLVERRAADPVLPLFLFRNNTFLVCNGMNLATGVALFGTITFIPFYLQIVQSMTPLMAGLGMVPVLASLVVSSAVTGQIMSRTGRYRMLPIAAMGLLTAGVLLLATLDRHTPYWQVAIYLSVVGVGIGPMMSVGVAAIQNAVPRSVLGVATASANMFRQIGGAVGVAVLGAIFNHRLAAEMNGNGSGGGAFDIQTVAALPFGEREAFLDAYVASLQPVFLVVATGAFLSFLLAFLLREVRLTEPALPPNPE